MTTGRQIKLARDRYTKQEWQRMTGLVAPLVVNPLTSGGLDTDEGIEVRDAIVQEVAHDLDYMVPFTVRVRRAVSDVQPWALELLSEADQACGLGHQAGKVIDDISHSFEDGGLTGPLFTTLDKRIVNDGARIYAYYLEDLFDDVVAAVEWQARAMEDD